jgi:hypothetical protein
MLRMTLKKALRIYAQARLAEYRQRNRLGGRKLSVRQEEEALESIAEAIKSTPKAVRSWLRGQAKPIGEPELRLICHLERRGFQIIEIESLDPDVREILWEISLGSIKLDWAMKRLGFSRQIDFLRVLRGTTLPNPEQVRKISRLIAMMEAAEIAHLQTLEEQLEKQGIFDEDKEFERRMRRLRALRRAKDAES